MQETGNNTNNTNTRLNIRISDNTLSFSAIDKAAEKKIVFDPYIVRSGISMAANLRDAFKNDEMLSCGYSRALILIDTPVLTVPIEAFTEDTAETLYAHTFTECPNCVILHSIVPELNMVAIFAINKDLKLVIDDHFSNVRFVPLMQSVWLYLHKRSYTGVRNKLYGYFHDKKLEILSYNQNRFKFCNTFDAAHSRDAAYFLLYVWKQLALDPQSDEMHIVGDIPEREWLCEALRRYLKNVYVINPTAEFNRAPITEIKGLPFDLMTLFMGK